MSARRFYTALFAPLEALLGAPDRDSIVSIIGFDAGGPLSFTTFGRERGDRHVTYVSCELAERPEQRPASFGRYELLATSGDEAWVRSIVSDIGRMSMDVAFDDGHTLDIAAWVDADAALQGVVFEKVCAVEIDGRSYGVLRVIGVTRDQLELALTEGTPALLAKLRAS